MRRPGDRTPEPPGGRAAARLRQFEDSRRPPVNDPGMSSANQNTPAPRTLRTGKKANPRHEKQARREK